MTTRLTLAGSGLLPEGQFFNATIAIQDKRIVSITPGADARADIVTDGWIIPGFIDLQINGAFGCDFTVDPGSVSQVAARLPETGVTAFLPTIISSPLEKYASILHDIERAIGISGDGSHAVVTGAQILGVHLEGPYLSRDKPGAHNPNLLRHPSTKELDTYLSRSLVRLVTLAPELPDSTEMIRALRARGIIVSAGHSTATYEQAIAGFQAGIT